MSVILIRFQPNLERIRVHENRLIICQVAGSVHTTILIKYLFGTDTDATKKCQQRSVPSYGYLMVVTYKDTAPAGKAYLICY